MMEYRAILIGGHSRSTEIERFETLDDALAFIDDANSDFASQYSSSDDYHNDGDALEWILDNNEGEK